LGQTFPALAAAIREDLAAPFGALAGKKTVLGTAFSFGRLIRSFNHSVPIIMTFFLLSSFFLQPLILFRFFFLFALRALFAARASPSL
jgi:hypothetical protein